MQSKNKDVIIRCPICGQEYLPSEIFMPDDLIGRPTVISKTQDGKIDFYLGENIDYKENYICDNCLSKMVVTAHVSYTVDIVGSDKSDDYVTKINTKNKEKENLFYDTNSAKTEH